MLSDDSGRMYDLLVVGAGVGGLAMAREVQQAQWRTLVLDKARGVSGRAATRYLLPRPKDDLPEGYTPLFSVPDSVPEAAPDSVDPEGTRQKDESGRQDDQNWFAKLDHGAHFLTARHPRTQRLVEGGLRTGWLGEWTGQFAQWEDGEIHVPALQTGLSHYAPLSGMNKLGAQLARPLEVQTGTLITSLARLEQGWRVFERSGDFFDTRRLVLNMPAPQLVSLIEDMQLPSSPHTENALAAAKAVRYESCWTAGMVLHSDLQAEWVALNLEDHPVLKWVSREHTKRADPEHPPALVVQAQSGWSQEHLDQEGAQIWPLLQAALEEIVGPVQVKEAFAHRWLYANPTQRAPYAFHWDEKLNLGWCGDWCSPDEHGPRIEAALLSGWRLGESMLRG